MNNTILVHGEDLSSSYAVAVADPGFLEWIHLFKGVGDSVCWFYHFFPKYPMKIK